MRGLYVVAAAFSRPTLRKWWRRYLAQGIAGLKATAVLNTHQQLRLAPTNRLILALLTLRNLGEDVFKAS
jgi:hypothetical protein